jgi:hypothetical protein
MNVMVLAVSDAVRYLAFPLTVLVMGALVTGWLVPRWTRRRDDHLRALEVKTQLVSDMSDIVIGFVTAVRFAVEDADTQEPKFKEDYKAWENRRAVLGTKLEAYFPATNIQDDWGDFVVAVRELFEITQEPDAAGLGSRASGLQETLIELRRRYRRERLLKRSRHQQRQRDRDDANEVDSIKTGDSLKDIEKELRPAVLDCKGELIKMIMEWRVDALEEPSVRERIRLRRMRSQSVVGQARSLSKSEFDPD